MAPSLITAVAGTALFAAHALATEKTYQVSESFTPDNFFSKFDFFEVGLTHGKPDVFRPVRILTCNQEQTVLPSRSI